jgi:hypothetical protein
MASPISTPAAISPAELVPNADLIGNVREVCSVATNGWSRFLINMVSRTDSLVQTLSLSYEDRLNGLLSSMRLIEQHPYHALSYIQLSQDYAGLGYPDLAAGTAYKALLLFDAIQDESDEYHERAVDSLSVNSLGQPSVCDQNGTAPSIEEVIETHLPRM